MDLLPFQLEASTQIADRFSEYMRDPLATKLTKILPFYQNLSSITGSGKTLILADAIEQIRTRLPLEPIVLWLSKGKVVVMQTLANLSSGKYSELIGGYEVKALLDCSQTDVDNSSRGLVLVATVGKFNQKDKEDGDRRIFRVGLDVADQSLWDSLKRRRDAKGRRRHLIVVYDEGHNLSNQQTIILADLEPDALLAASATPRVPEALAKNIERLREEKGWRDEDFTTVVPSSRVVEAGLIKKHLLLGGYVTPMEFCIDELLEEMAKAEAAAGSLDLPLLPKAIYVSTTNAVDGATPREDANRPFHERQARPILIWRYLVENRGIEPSSIAVYCDLKFDKKFAPPPGFNLFAGGDSDFDRFMSGSFRHVIFNLSLQEGWDDPSCCFAYIDKDMGSPDQVTQVVGRVLRQPGAQHYSATVLNTAHFYIRTDEKGVFEFIIDDVKRKIASQVPDVTLMVRSSSTRIQRPSLPARKERFVPNASINSEEAYEPIREIVNGIIDFRVGDLSNTVGTGARMQVLQSIGTGEEAAEEWVEMEHSNRVTARWIFSREVQRHRPKAIRLCDIEDAKFDAMIEYHSKAANHLREKAGQVVEAYVDHSVLVQNFLDHPYVVGPVPITESRMEKFRYAIHEGYSDLNELEKTFARAIDKTQKVWCRNPTSGGFSVDLLDRGKTRQFKPDFLVWSDKDRHVVAIDTKGDHLIHEDAGRKLFDVPKIEEGPELVIRLVTEGEWHVRGGELMRTPGSDGFTVWKLKHGKLHAAPCRTALLAVRECLSLG